jgi:TATA-box binding protein (TBP) (component of TFIID and TFIIIB)
MKKRLTKEELVEMIEDKYLNSNSIEDMLDLDFIVDMYINGYKGVANYEEEEFTGCVERELDIEIIKKFKNGKYEINGENEDDGDF